MSYSHDRLQKERLDLESKIESLIDFMHGGVYPSLTATDQGLLMVQLSHMKGYATTLRDRIDSLSLAGMK